MLLQKAAKNETDYQKKKTYGQGLMDIALFTANSNQLRNVLSTNGSHPFYTISIVAIVFSLILQIYVMIGLTIRHRNDESSENIHKAFDINDRITIGIMLITAANIFISAFDILKPNA